MLGWLFSCGPSRVSSPAGADSLFFVLPKKSKQKKGAPEMATSPWICVTGRRGRQTRFAQTRLLPLSARLQKSKAPSRAGTAKPSGCGSWRLFSCRPRAGGDPVSLVFMHRQNAAGFPLSRERQNGDGLAFDVPALCGALNFCERAEKRRRPV